MSDPSNSNECCQPSGSGARSMLGNRRVVIGAAVALGTAGLWFGWPWLVVAGVAPLLIALAPCLIICGAMCAIGACKSKPIVAGSVVTTKDDSSYDEWFRVDGGKVLEPHAPKEAGWLKSQDRAAHPIQFRIKTQSDTV